MLKGINIGLPPQIKSSRNSLFEIVLLIVVCALFSWFIIMPKKAKVQAKKSELAKYAQEQSKMASNLQNFNRLVAELNSHEQEIKNLDDALPLEGKTTYLEILIQNLANSAGVAVGDIGLSGKNDVIAAGNTELIKNPYGATRTLQKISGTVSVIGSFAQMRDFLKKIETSGRVMQISSVDIVAAQDNNLSLRIALDAYYLAP